MGMCVRTMSCLAARLRRLGDGRGTPRRRQRSPCGLEDTDAPAAPVRSRGRQPSISRTTALFRCPVAQRGLSRPRGRLADTGVIGGGSDAHPVALGARAALVTVKRTTAVHRHWPLHDAALLPGRATGGTSRPQGRPANTGIIGGGGGVQQARPHQRPTRAAPLGASFTSPCGEFLSVQPFFNGVGWRGHLGAMVSFACLFSSFSKPNLTQLLSGP